MSLDGGIGTLCYGALEYLPLAAVASLVVLLGKIGILAATKGDSAVSSGMNSILDQEEGGILPVVVRVSSVRYNFVIALTLCVSGSYLLQIVLQVATKIIRIDLPLILYALAGLTTFTTLCWTQRIDRETRGRHFLPILRWTTAIGAMFEVAIVTVSIRIVYDKQSGHRLSISVAELSITVFRLLILLALLYASSPVGERVSYEPLIRPDASNERTNLVKPNGAVQRYGSDGEAQR